MARAHGRLFRCADFKLRDFTTCHPFIFSSTVSQPYDSCLISSPLFATPTSQLLSPSAHKTTRASSSSMSGNYRVGMFIVPHDASTFPNMICRNLPKQSCGMFEQTLQGCRHQDRQGRNPPRRHRGDQRAHVDEVSPLVSCCQSRTSRSSLTLTRGCVTPAVLHNWWDKADHDLELIDGYEELPAEAQEKVKRALENTHVDDEDWNGVGLSSTHSLSPVLIDCRTLR